MKKAIITLAVLCGIGLLAACKSGTASDSATTDEITWTTIEDKLADGILLDENDCLFILTDTTLDDGHSEGIGNHLFNFLCGYPKSNRLFIDARKDFTKDEGDKKMLGFMNLMSIDIVLAEYENYEEFLGDFPMFKGCKGAEELFNAINANGI